MKRNKFNIPVVNNRRLYFNLPRFIWVSKDNNNKLHAIIRYENRKLNFIQFGIKIIIYEK